MSYYYFSILRATAAATATTGAQDALVCFSFFTSVLTYTQGAEMHNTDNRMQAHMRRLRRVASRASQVCFHFHFHILLTIIYE
jgi:predicted membrane-bound mannosyltransferase